MYFILGALFVGIQLIIHSKLAKMDKAKIWPNCIMVLVSNALIIFSIAWGYESIIEYESQAAIMGLVAFGGLGIIFAIIAYRIINKSEKPNKECVEVNE